MSDDLRWTEHPPTIDNPDEAKKAQEILDREPGVPRGQQTAEDLKPAHREELSPLSSQLDPERAWFFTALAYCMVGMDRSLFELYAQHLDQPVDVITYRPQDKPIALFDGADIRSNPWFYTIQGIPHELAMGFIDYIESFKFNDQTRSLEWVLGAHHTRLADPLVTDQRVGASVYLLLPECLSSRRRVVVTQEPGLKLDELCLGIQVREV